MGDELVRLLERMTDEQLGRVIERLPDGQREHIASVAEEYKKAIGRERGQKSFMEFVKMMWPNFIAGRHHQIMADAFERVARGDLKRLIINMPPRHRLCLDTPIPTVRGWKTVETVEVGDYVFAPDGCPVAVTGKSAVYEEDIFEVVTSDGQIIECDGEHLWTVRFGSSRPFETLSTLKILHKLETETWRKFGNLPMLPPQSAAQYPCASLPIDPYVLGVWLGDGSSSGASIGCSYRDMPQMRKQVEDCGYQTTHNPKYQQFNVLGLHKQLRETGLLNNKHIPEVYMCAAVEQRMSLLQGLIDTDGDVGKGGRVTFNQTNRALTEQVLCLIHSLGIKARITTRQTDYRGVPCQRSYRIMFTASGVARLPRKANRCRSMHRGRSIDIRRTNRRGKVQCLEIKNEDGLFMAGRGWVVTHNTKSEFASYLLPAWYLGKFPAKKIIQSSNTAELAVGFGRKVRNLVDGETYTKVFPNVALRHDSKAAGRWATNRGGEYFAIGVGGTLTGKGADLLIIDDPHSEQEAKLAESDPSIFDSVYEWYTSGPRQRLQPGGSIVVVMTRWSKRDLTGRVMKDSVQRGGDEWELIEFPAILPSDKPLWPEFWSYEELSALRAELPNSKWQAQYQQSPTSESAAIVKREWWRMWHEDSPPPCTFTLMAWDTAFEKSNRSDYSACTIWGVFYHPDDNGLEQANIILLNAIRNRVEFPELKKMVMRAYKDWEPDSTIIEKKASGAPLIYELRAMGISVQEFTPVKGNDKITRLNAVSDLFASGRVWAPNTNWAEEVMDEVASFPSGEHDDYVDTVSLALMRFRKGGYIRTDLDDDDDNVKSFRRRPIYY
jgi:predicted phage terminase large subunit-like protein